MQNLRRTRQLYKDMDYRRFENEELELERGVLDTILAGWRKKIETRDETRRSSPFNDWLIDIPITSIVEYFAYSFSPRHIFVRSRYKNIFKLYFALHSF